MSERRYHVGDLPGRLLREAREMLEAGEPLNLRALAARAGITAGSMYHHFESKTALLAEIAVSGFMELGRELERADGEAPPGSRLRGWARAYFRFAQREAALFGVMFDPEITELPPVVTARNNALDSLRRIVSEVSAARGGVDPPLDQITRAVWAASHGAASLALSAPGRAGLIDDVIGGLEALFRPPR